MIKQRIFSLYLGSQSWRDDLLVNTTYFSCRGSELHSQYPCLVAPVVHRWAQFQVHGHLSDIFSLYRHSLYELTCIYPCKDIHRHKHTFKLISSKESKKTYLHSKSKCFKFGIELESTFVQESIKMVDNYMSISYSKLLANSN